MPDGFPPLTLTIMRALCALSVLRAGEEGQKSMVSCLDALFAAYWVEGKNTIDKAILAEELTRVLGAEDTGKSEWHLLFPRECASKKNWLTWDGCSPRDGGEGGEGSPSKEYGSSTC